VQRLERVSAYLGYLHANGGPLIWVLWAMLLLGLLIIVSKALTLRRRRIVNARIVQHIEQLLLNNKFPEATEYCKSHPMPITRIILAGILNFDRNEAQLKEILEEAGRQEIPLIRRYLTTLGTIAGVAPFVGLLGTVLGMMDVFAKLGQGDSVNAGDLAGGISQALITTAVGLVIAIPALAFYNSFNARASNIIIEMEKIALRIVAIFNRNRSTR
jgi:biopolymer transport protein ExbB